MKKSVITIFVLLSIFFLIVTNCQNIAVEEEDIDKIVGAWIQCDASYDPSPNQYVNDYNMFIISDSKMLKGYINQASNGNFYWNQIYHSYTSSAAELVTYTYSRGKNYVKFKIDANPTLGHYENWRFVFDSKTRARVYYGNNFDGSFVESPTPLYYKKVENYNNNGLLVKQTLVEDAYEAGVGNDTKGNAKPINLNIYIKPNFHDATDDDWFEFIATNGVDYTIETSFNGNRIYDFCDNTVLGLYSGAIPPLVTNDDISSDNLFSKITWTCPGDGTYYVLIYPKDHSADLVGTYQFMVSD